MVGARERRVFGTLTVPHGHNYTLDVTVRGPIDPTTGMVIDLADLKRVVGDDGGRALRSRRPERRSALPRAAFPTTENIAIAVWDLLVPKLGRERLWQVRVWEDPTLYVDYRGRGMTPRRARPRCTTSAPRTGSPARPCPRRRTPPCTVPCARAHGHNYYVEVTVTGAPDPVHRHGRRSRRARPAVQRERSSTTSITTRSRTCPRSRA